MPKLTHQFPKLYKKTVRRGGKTYEYGYVKLDGIDIKCGRWDDPETQQEYLQLITQWQANGRELPDEDPDSYTCADLAADFLTFADTYYVKWDPFSESYKKTEEVRHIQRALGLFLELFADTQVTELTTASILQYSEHLIAQKKTNGLGLARKTINSHVDRVKRAIYKMAESKPKLQPIADRVKMFKGLGRIKKGRNQAVKEHRETGKARPVAWEDIEPVLHYLTPTVADMLRLQWFCGMRPQEVRIMRACDIDMGDGSEDVWIYTPAKHKTEHQVDEPRHIGLGPRAIAILGKYLADERLANDDFLFSPALSVEDRRKARAASRKTPKNQGNRRGYSSRTREGRQPKRAPGKLYSKDSYIDAVSDALRRCNRDRTQDGLAEIPKWTPNQMRHSFCARANEVFTLEEIRHQTGHNEAMMTAHYAGQSIAQAKRVVREVG